jgi:hypothetical protein
VRERVVAVAQQPVEQDADGEQVGGDVPAIQPGVGRLIRRRARLRMHGIADPGGDVEVEQFRPGAGEHHVERLDVAVDQPAVLQVRQLARLGFGQLAGLALIIELLDAGRVGMKGDERVQQVERHVDGLPVAQVPPSGGELVE